MGLLDKITGKKKEAKEDMQNIRNELNDKFNVESEESIRRFKATKPPR